jgi:3',5'-cyclic AMP phosphodiesterase CpdA
MENKKPVDQNWIAILNDPHVAADQPWDSAIPTNLRTTVEWLISQPQFPAAAIINGDLAMFDGQADDYRYFAKLIVPLLASEISLYLTMGNHDDRQRFLEVLPDQRLQNSEVPGRQTGFVELPLANIILLDSLKDAIVAPGKLGAAQLEWLENKLDKHSGKPAIIIVHHNPRFGGAPVHYPGGLEDSCELWNIIKSRKCVKAIIHGHTHERRFTRHEMVHIIDAPSAGYVADENEATTGWTMLRLSENGAEFSTHTHRADHPWNGAKVQLQWRGD